MTIVRRLLIAIVGLLLLLDAAALGLVKFASGPKPSAEKSKVVIWVDNVAQAESALAKLKEAQLEPILKPAKRSTFVDANFRLVMSASRKELLEPVAKVLRKGGHKQLSFNEDGTLLYYGAPYPSKSKAKAVARSLKTKEMLVFEVQPGKKKVMKPSHRIILLEVSDNMVTSITAPLEDDETIEVAEVEEFPINPEPVEEDEAE